MSFASTIIASPRAEWACQEVSAMRRFNTAHYFEKRLVYTGSQRPSRRRLLLASHFPGYLLASPIGRHDSLHMRHE